MSFSAPKKSTFRLALLAAIVSLALQFVEVGVPADVSYWLMTAAFILLALGSVFSGL